LLVLQVRRCPLLTPEYEFSVLCLKAKYLMQKFKLWAKDLFVLLEYIFCRKCITFIIIFNSCNIWKLFTIFRSEPQVIWGIIEFNFFGKFFDYNWKRLVLYESHQYIYIWILRQKLRDLITQNPMETITY